MEEILNNDFYDLDYLVEFENESIDNLLNNRTNLAEVKEVYLNKLAVKAIMRFYNSKTSSNGTIVIDPRPTFDFVKKGDVIAYMEWGQSWEIIAPDDGFFIPISSKSFEIDLKKIDLELLSSFAVGHISMRPEILLSRYFNMESVIEMDPFSRTKSVKWGEQGMNNNLNFIFSDFSFSFDFLEDEGVITFRFNEDIKISKGDTISFLFEDGTILDYPITKKPTISSDGCVSSCTLYQEDIDKFVHSKPQIYRISYQGNSRSPITNDIMNVYYGPFKYIAIVAYSLNYLNTIKRLVPDYQFPYRHAIKEQRAYSFEGCFVYIMRDNITRCYKIGISNNPEYRERTLQSEKPSIDLLACKKFPTRKIAEAIESALHSAFANKRIRGEWFNLDEVEVATIIETLK